MVTLKLISLKCITTEDLTGPDEIYLRIGGDTVWGPNSMNDGDEENLDFIQINFGYKIRIDLYDEDSGWFDDDDDHLGTHYAYEEYVGKGQKEQRFTGDDAEYLLTYEIVESPGEPS
ncbi:hypothetical protein [Nannocystis punicea]|uniref:Uncharacterized protein n=1 Tax=Nannocystis punicea TaxID=2995304 RepID=A0ABY7GV29_9BACT|nr:hypothetical protein [Nannocystis poenicansa]WAS90797.1 hypothetical protein O0S08_31805 [Nannocystis poenicansa]